MSVHSILRSLYYKIPPRGRIIARRLFYLPADLFRKRDPLTPPKGMIFIGSGDFRERGKEQLEAVIKYTSLRPDANVLDVGSGIGRLAVAMTDYLVSAGSFDGFDVVKDGVLWCEKNITKRFPNFRFKHVDLKNDLYNLSTENEAKSFVFPYVENSFDVITLFSVFTHMMPDDIDNYLAEIARVLKPGGCCVATFFIIDEYARKQIDAGQTGEFTFDYSYDGYFLFDDRVKEANVAYDKDYLLQMIAKHQLLVPTIEYGTWSDHSRGTTQFQDLVVLSKK